MKSLPPQLTFGLMSDWAVLLLDEARGTLSFLYDFRLTKIAQVTVDLDVLVRDDLLTFLKNESETRGATILCAIFATVAVLLSLFTHGPGELSDATHIFDGLNNFPTHVAHMRFGSFVKEPTAWPFSDGKTLYSVALNWLAEDRQYRKKLEAEGRKTRGARRDQVCLPCDLCSHLCLIFLPSGRSHRLRSLLPQVRAVSPS